ncbi:hypothetical protein F53441_12735 [Fusarium austroafricanum]|uniref:BTB domain-containing protein n=1 Tax=Fusarium austroafricanum TaxID=2364996 RepID=A0A8H4NI35_9HYPO|nr:hypothetical protein F53441_12735 [Fusarium austroafricanum]
MVHYASGSEPTSTQEGPQKTPPSKKPSDYVFDSNGDTQLILSTYMSQTFEWEADKIWIKREKPTKKYLRRKKLDKKKGKKLAFCPPPAPPPPPAPLGSPASTSTLLGEAPNVSFSDFSNVQYSRPEFSDDDEMEPGCTHPETIADSTNLRMQDWDYGETRGTLVGKIEFRMLVSGKHLELASSLFKTMLTGPFVEGKADDSGLRRVTASDWDPEAFKIVLTIMHGYHRDVPKSLSLEMLAKLAMIVDYYECHECVELYTDIWLEGLKSEMPTVYGRDCILCMFISWVFSQPDMFRNMTQIALRYSGKLIEAENFPIPADILEQIDEARQSVLEKIFPAIYDLLDRLQEEETDCTYECSSMLLGFLTKALRKHEVLSPPIVQPFNGSSIEDSTNMIKNLKKPEWYTAGGSYYGRHHCTIQGKLSISLDEIEKELRVFNLQDFQFAKSHTRS